MFPSIKFLHGTAKPKGGTCAIAQMEGVHEEVIPSLVAALNASGIRPSVYINDRCLEQRGDVFEGMDELDCDVHYVPVATRPDWNKLASKIKGAGHEFLVMSTYQREGVAEWARQIGIPILGLVHNVRMFLDVQACMDSVKSGQARLLCLAPHVAAYLNQRLPADFIDRTGVVESVYWGEKVARREAAVSSNGRRVAVPGGVSFQSRAFVDLVKALEANRAGAKGIRFQILGGGKDRAALEKLFVDKGLSEHVEFAPLGPNGRVLYKEYIAALMESDILHPLAPLSFAPYREHKITSAVPTAAGFCLPIVLDRWTARVYRAPSIETDATLPASIEAILSVGPDELAAQRQAMAAYRDQTLARNAAEMARIVGQLHVA